MLAVTLPSINIAPPSPWPLEVPSPPRPPALSSTNVLPVTVSDPSVALK